MAGIIHIELMLRVIYLLKEKKKGVGIIYISLHQKPPPSIGTTGPRGDLSGALDQVVGAGGISP